MLQPVVPPTGECKPFQEVLIELGGRLKLPVFAHPDGSRKYRDYPDFIVNYETEPGSGIGFLAGWRGKGGEKFLIGEPNPRQWEMYEQHDCVFHYELPRSYQYMRNWNQGYLEWSRSNRITRYAEPILIHLYSEVLQRFRSAAQGKGLTRKPPEHLKKRIETYFDPLPFFYEPLESHVTDKHKYPLAAVTQRPMAMYHSWDSQNAWLRQIHTHNVLFINTQTARTSGIADSAGWRSGRARSKNSLPSCASAVVASSAAGARVAAPQPSRGAARSATTIANGSSTTIEPSQVIAPKATSSSCWRALSAKARAAASKAGTGPATARPMAPTRPPVNATASTAGQALLTGIAPNGRGRPPSQSAGSAPRPRLWKTTPGSTPVLRGHRCARRRPAAGCCGTGCRWPAATAG